MTIKILKKNQIKLLFLYAKLEGWDVDEIHIKALYKTNPNDFIVVFKDKKLVGFVLAIKHTNKFGFISTLLILKEFRSLGFGKIIFKYALQHLDGCQIALDSVTGYESFYENFNFKSYFEVYTYKYITNSSMAQNSIIKVYNFDKKSSLKNKNEYQKLILKNKNVKYKEIRQNHNTNSFAYTYSYIDGYKITIQANDIDETLALFFSLTKEFESKTNIYLEANRLSPTLLNMTKILDMKIHTKLIRMYNKIV